MVKFKEVDPEQIDNLRRGRRGRVSYPILKGFLETDFFLAELDPESINRTTQGLTASLSIYVKNHGLPVKIFQRTGTVYMMRLDMDEDGNEIPDWEEKEFDLDLAKPITAEVVAEHLTAGEDES